MSRNGFELVNGRVVPRPGYGLMRDGSLVENPVNGSLVKTPVKWFLSRTLVRWFFSRTLVRWFSGRNPGKMVLW